jgi:hypothetical protein
MTQAEAADTTAAQTVPGFAPTTLYQQLTAPFEHYQHDKRSGAEFDYITGEQCLTRLNTVFGVGGWYFKVVTREIVPEADEVLVEGEMGAYIDGQWVVRTQFGSQKLKRGRETGKILDVGFDFKGAATDCIKKCASLFGVALHLYEKEPPRADDARHEGQQRPARQAPQRRQQQQPVEESQAASDTQIFPMSDCQLRRTASRSALQDRQGR